MLPGVDIWSVNFTLIVAAVLSLAGTTLAATVPINVTGQLVTVEQPGGKPAMAKIKSVEYFDPYEFLNTLNGRKRDDILATMASGPHLGPNYHNVTYINKPIGVEITTEPVIVHSANLEKRISDNGGCSECWYSKPVWAWKNANACMTKVISKSTKFSFTIDAPILDAISASLGVEREVTKSEGTMVCVVSLCNCQRMWTTAKMTWADGTVFKDHYKSRCCAGNLPGGGQRMRSEEVKTLHVDAGKKDPKTGFLEFHPGGSPCSDGPPGCYPQDWGCPIPANS